MIPARHAPIYFAATLALLTMAASAAAQSIPAARSAPADTTDRFKLNFDLGLVAASGNTNLTTFTFAEKLDVLAGKWRVQQGARMVNGKSDGIETVNEYAVFVQPEYRLARRWKAYALGSWDRNPFIGIVQRFQEGVGASFSALLGPRHFLTLEAGVSFFQQEFTSGTSSSFPTGRAQGTYKFAITPKAYVQDILIYLPNLEETGDYRINNELAVVAPIMNHLALKASYVLQYQSAPQPGFGTTDNLYTTGLQVTF